jgi:hypothetical protein
MRAAIFAFGLAVVFGLVLGLLLTGPGPGASGIIGGQYWAIVLIAASVYLGWQVAQFSNSLVSLVAAPVLVVLMIAVLFAVKFVRVPWAPLVGDAFEIVVAIYAAAGLLGAAIGRAPSLRARTAAAAARTGLVLAATAVAFIVVTYGLASVLGS